MSSPQRLVVLFLLVLFGWMALGVSPHVGVTADETAHLTAGYAYWFAHDYRLQPENGNLPQRWAALPLWLGHVHFPRLEGEAWQQADVWHLGREFFFHDGNDPASLLFAGRGMIVLFGVALAAVAYGWSRRLYGVGGGLVTLGFIVFCPHLLAHGALITSDMAATLGFMLALLTWWRLCHRLTPGRILAAGAAAGVLALSKYSAVIFAPIALAMLAVRLARPSPLPCHLGGWRRRVRGRWRMAGLLAGGGLAAAALAVGLIWSAYGFRYAAAAAPGGNLAEPWSQVLIAQPQLSGSVMADGRIHDPVTLQPGIVQRFAGWARDHRVLPEAWLYGLAFTDLHARGRLAYFAGEYRETGWWEFFPVAFALKTTLPALLLFGLAFAGFARSPVRLRSRWLYRLAPLLIFGAGYWIFAITSHLNIGHRHLLPLYPTLFILAGVVGSRPLWARSRGWLAVALALLAWHAGESWSVRPQYLTYFNELAGGPAGGHRYFVDSSLDWGQGLPDLKSWLDIHRGHDPVFLSYFGSDDPTRLGLKATRIGDAYFDFSRRPLLPRLTGGIYCLSATMFHRVYTQVRGPWSPAYEGAYQSLARDLAANAIPPAEMPDALVRFDQLRFGRLCHFLAGRPPDALVANTIFIFRLDDAELAQALQAPPTD
ncbi:MAG: glycosyltransferase family 39 protein [Opitutales bacterium]